VVRSSLLKQIPIKLTSVLANDATFTHLDKLIGNRTARMSFCSSSFPLVPSFSPPSSPSFPASSPRLLCIYALVYSAEWLTVISAVSTKSKLIAAVRRMQSPGKQAFRRLAGLIVRGKLRLLVRSRLFFFCFWKR